MEERRAYIDDFNDLCYNIHMSHHTQTQSKMSPEMGTEQETEQLERDVLHQQTADKLAKLKNLIRLQTQSA